MDANFRFTFDDFVPIADEPIGWDQSKIVIKRNDDFGGLFLEYVTELEFWGDGYAYIKNQIDSLGYCFSVKVSIEYQCYSNGPYENVFTGYANISRAEIDEQKCTIKTNLEVDNIYADFLNSADRQITLSPTPTSFPNGEVVSAGFQTISYHNVETGRNTLNEPTDNRALAVETINALNYLSKIITEGQLDVVSDFFTIATPLLDIWKVEFTGDPIKSGDTVSITYRNMWGYTETKSQTFTGTIEITLTQLMFKCMDHSDTSTMRGAATACNVFMHFAFSYGIVDVTPDVELFLFSWLPIEIISAEVTGSAPLAVATITQTGQYQKGGQGLYLTTQLNETFNSQIWNFQALTSSTLSFRQLWDELCALYNLGMQLEGTPGEYKLRIEPMEYFFALDSQIRISGVDEIKSYFDTGANFKLVNLSSGDPAMGAIGFPQAFTPDGVMAMGSDTMTWTFSNQIPSVGDYIYSTQSDEVFRVLTVGPGSTLTTTDPTIFGITSSHFFIGSYQQIDAYLAWVNTQYEATVGNCVGDILELNNTFVTEIEKHGDQTQSRYRQTSIFYVGVSAGASKKAFTFMHCNKNTLKSIGYPYYVVDQAGSPIYERTAFNATLTNHHKIMNNYLRLKYDATAYMPSFAENAGLPLIIITTTSYSNIITPILYVCSNFNLYCIVDLCDIQSVSNDISFAIE